MTFITLAGSCPQIHGGRWGDSGSPSISLSCTSRRSGGKLLNWGGRRELNTRRCAPQAQDRTDTVSGHIHYSKNKTRSLLLGGRVAELLCTPRATSAPPPLASIRSLSRPDLTAIQSRDSATCRTPASLNLVYVVRIVSRLFPVDLNLLLQDGRGVKLFLQKSFGGPARRFVHLNRAPSK